MTTYQVGHFVGSLSSTSVHRLLSEALIRIAPDHRELCEAATSNLPLSDSNLDNDDPPGARLPEVSVTGRRLVQASRRG